MKRLTIILLMLLSTWSFGQTPTFKWVKEVPFEISCQCTDDEDNIYIAGDISDTTVFENITLFGQDGEAVVSKFDSSGSLLWFRQFGGTQDGILDLEIDHNGDLVILGVFNYSTIYFGDTIAAPGHGAVITKLTKNGDLIWYKIPGTSDHGCIHVSALSIDQDNNILITGDLQWGNGIFSDTIILTNGMMPGFAAKFNYNGELEWVRKFSKLISQCAFDFSNNVLIFTDTIQKYSATNEFIWGKKANVFFPNSSSWPKVATDSLDNSYITTNFDNTIYIGSDSLNSISSSKFLFVKLDSEGNPIFSISIHNTDGFSPNSISLNKENIGLTGTFKNKLFFDDDSLISVTNLRYNSFLALYDLSGNLKFIKKIDGKNGCSSQLISVGKSIYVSGYSYDTTYFDDIAFVNGHSWYTRGYFLARLQNEVVHPIVYPETFSLFPNPTQGNMTIRINPAYLDASLEIYDMQGKLIIRCFLDSYSISMNIEHLTNGLYIIKIRTSEKTLIKKIEKI